MTSNLYARVVAEIGTCGGCGKNLRGNKGLRTCDSCGKPLPEPSRELTLDVMCSPQFATHINPQAAFCERRIFGYRLFPEK